MSNLPSRILDYVPNIQQLRLMQNPWHCDCSVSYLAVWLRTKYFQSNLHVGKRTNSTNWDFSSGVICQGPGSFGGKLVVQFTAHELCIGQWASMKGLVPRLPIDNPMVNKVPVNNIFSIIQILSKQKLFFNCFILDESSA